MATFNDLSGIRFLSQNVNSLNLSTGFQLNSNLNRFDQKFESILDKKAEIILLQDIRLGKDGEKILKKRLEFSKFGSYHTYTNSTQASRGVAILIKSNILVIYLQKTYKNHLDLINLIIFKYAKACKRSFFFNYIKRGTYNKQ